MTTFSAIDIGRTGVGFAGHWIDTLAHNIANVNTIRPEGEEPFRARMLVARPLGDQFASTGSGVYVADVVEDDSGPMKSYAPGHPLAAADGTVVQPVVDLTAQMTDLMLANRTYQANLRTIETAKEAYQSALRIGR